VASRSVDFRNSSNGPNCFIDVVDQKTGLPVLDYFTARTEVHCDHGNARGVRFDQHKSESFRDGVQVQENSGPSKQFVLTPHVHRSDIEDVLIVKMGFDLLPKIGFVLDNTSDDQTHSAQTSNLDRQMNTFIGVDPSKENQVIPAAFLKRIQREINAVVDGR